MLESDDRLDEDLLSLTMDGGVIGQMDANEEYMRAKMIKSMLERRTRSSSVALDDIEARVLAQNARDFLHFEMFNSKN